MQNRISELRNEFFMTTKELAKKLNVGVRSIQKYEKGDVSPTPEKLVKMTEIFNCSIDYLLCLNNSRNELSNKNIRNLTNDKTMKVFTENLKNIMIDKELTKEQLANKVKIEKKQLELFLKGVEFPSLDIMINLSKVLNVSLDYLIDYNNVFDANRVHIKEKYIEIKVGKKIKKIPIHKFKDFLSNTKRK